jgi:hypothetical protein
MKFFDTEDGLDGYIILVEKDDLKKPLDLTELQGEWADIKWEGVSKKNGYFHAVKLLGNEGALSFYIPDAVWLDSSLRHSLEAHIA